MITLTQMTKLHKALISKDILVENKVLNNKNISNNIHLLIVTEFFNVYKTVHTSKNVILK